MKAALLLAGMLLGVAAAVSARAVAASGAGLTADHFVDADKMVGGRDVMPPRDLPKVPNELTGLSLVADRRRFVDPFAGEAFATLN